MSNYKTIKRAQERVQRLIDNFDKYVDIFNQSNQFVGPSVYFHRKVLEKLQWHKNPVETIKDDMFFDYLYAMLTAWGLHRMGPGKTKLTEINLLKNSFMNQKQSIKFLTPYDIDKIPEKDEFLVISKIWELIENIQVSVSKTKIVAGSKALHHLLPNLIPPIDREYTIRFFYHHKNLNQGDEKAFKEIYPFFIKIAKSCKSNIKNQLGVGPMATSKTKIIDNAIVGYVLKELKN